LRSFKLPTSLFSTLGIFHVAKRDLHNHIWPILIKNSNYQRMVLLNNKGMEVMNLPIDLKLEGPSNIGIKNLKHAKVTYHFHINNLQGKHGLW
jgi:hypothetical protein